MAIETDKLVDLLARSIPQVQIAKAMGLDESRISQLAHDPRVSELVIARQSELAMEDVQTVTDLEAVNKTLLSRMEELADSSDSLAEVVNAYEKLGKIENQKKGLSTESTDGIRTITMAVPIFLQQNLNIQVNSRNEIVDIDNRAMTTMPTLSVHKMIKEQKAAQVQPPPVEATIVEKEEDYDTQDKTDPSHPHFSPTDVAL